MKIQQLNWHSRNGWSQKTEVAGVAQAQFVLVFAASSAFNDLSWMEGLRSRFPKAGIIGCSTSGEISGAEVNDDTVVATAVYFEKSKVSHASVEVLDANHSFDAAANLMQQLPQEGLRHVFVLSDGLNVNGSELVRGLRSILPEGISVTGGLAGDGADFKQTYVFEWDGKPAQKKVTAIGFYGDSLDFGYGSFGGWDSFGIDRKVTRSINNVLYELDGTPALEVYKSFLGDQAKGLPATGLLFPLSMRTSIDGQPVVRTILAVNEAEQSITFAGDITEGAMVRLMKANTDRLIQGALKAGEIASSNMEGSSELAVMISCVGRKLVLKQMVEEEVEAALEALGTHAVSTGFYSYGEISPFSEGAACELHNQTMTITTVREH